MIIGCGGSGKSTLAKQLHRITNLPVFHLDQYFFSPNWVETEPEKWKGIVDKLSDKEEWILDGNYGGTMDIRLEKADTIIFLSRPNWLCMFRVFKRMLTSYGQTRADMALGCKERFQWSFFVYLYHYNRTRRPTILKKMAYWQDKKDVVILQSDKAIQNYLKSIERI